MKNTYKVTRVDLTNIHTIEDYWKAQKVAPVKYCKGLAELDEYVGGRLRRERRGYAGIIGNVEYVAVLTNENE